MAQKKKEQSIYEYICDHIVDGVLPEDLEMPQDQEGDMHFAPGAADGIYIFHVPQSGADEEEKAQIESFLRDASDGRFDKAEETAAALGKKRHALPLMSDMQQFVADHIDELNPENLFQFACIMIEMSPDKECVKFGLGLSDLFECRDEGFHNTIRTLGLSDEFTVYCVISMLMWHNGNEEIFDLVKKVHGWGRIHAIDRLRPETQEIRDWLFYEGIDNTVLPGYSAFPVFVNSEAEKRLDQKMDRKDFEAMSRLIEALLPDEPVPGLSTLANADEILMKFLERAGEQSLTEGDLDLIREIRLFARNEEHVMPDLDEACTRLLSS